MGVPFFSSKCINFVLCLLVIFCTLSCVEAISTNQSEVFRAQQQQQKVLPGIYAFDELLSRLHGKQVGVVTNHTGLIHQTHVVDSLLNAGVKVEKVFAPEHGFRGDRPDGEEFGGGRDSKTGIEIISLYGKNKKPTNDQLDGIDIVLFDIQDVGARFYTYLSTLHYVIQACAENGIPLLVADRPNPHAHYVDGPVMQEENMSFVGLHPVPIVYGMTIGEYAQMINGESWHGLEKCNLEILPCLNYTRNAPYDFPVKPSPNLPTMESILLYPSLCLFEGTTVSVGRGTDWPFTIIGEPNNEIGNFEFTPMPKEGASIHPKHQGVKCRGYDLRSNSFTVEFKAGLDFSWLEKMYQESTEKEVFFLDNGYFEKLSGTHLIKESIVKGTDVTLLRKSWQKEIDNFKKIRAKYLIYSN